MRQQLPLLLATHLGLSAAFRLPFRRESGDALAVRSTSFNFDVTSDPFNFDEVDFTGDNQVIYSANITVDGNSYEIQLDTGSADFFLDTQGVPFTNVNDTSINATLVYGDKTAAVGNVIIAPVTFGNFSVASQAVLNAPKTNATSDNDRGLLGLGPNSLSVIYQNLANSSFNGQPLLNNIFSQNPSVSNYITFLLTRNQLGISDGGIFTIGEVDPSWSAVLNQPQIPIAQNLDQWIGVMDAVIVNGKNYTGHGLLSKTKKKINATLLGADLSNKALKKKTLSVFDTGTSTGFMPQHYFDAVYKGVDLKVLDKKNGIYELPCDTRVNVSMVFNGTEYPINPIDMTSLYEGNNNKTVCITSWSSMDTSAEGIDFVLGDAFLRNVYILYNYGNWTNNGTNPPYVQMLSTTNQSQAWAQYGDAQSARLAQWNSLNGTFTPSS